MPKPRYGEIPATRLSEARRVRDRLQEWLGTDGYVVVSIRNGGYSIHARIFEGVRLSEPIPRELAGIPVKVDRVKRIYPTSTKDEIPEHGQD